MPITAEVVGKNPFNLFGLRSNQAQDTPEGVRVRISKHDRNHLAGSRQQHLRAQLGLKLDESAEDVLIIVGQTIASLLQLRQQYEEKKAETARASLQETVNQLNQTLDRLNVLEHETGASRTSKEELYHQFDEPFTCERDAIQALKRLEERHTILTSIRELLPQINALRSVFEEITVHERWLMVNGCQVSYNRETMDELARNPNLTKDTEKNASELVEKFKNRLTETGFITEESDSYDDDTMYRIVPIKGWFDSEEIADQIFLDIFGFCREDLGLGSFYVPHREVWNVSLNNVWGSNIDTLLLMRKILKI